ncbi:MAG: DUF4386 domain-containing protein [Spirochaetota bacterium]
MNPVRRRSLWIGVLFLVATTSYLAGSGMVESIVTAPDPPAAIGEASETLLAGIVLDLVNVGAVIGIGVLMARVVRTKSPVAASGYAASRLVEGALLALSEMSVLALAGITGSAGPAASEALKLVADFAIEVRFVAFDLAMIALPVWLIVKGFRPEALLESTESGAT